MGKKQRRKYNPDFINKAFETYMKTGDIAPLLHDLKCLTYHFAEAYNIKDEFFIGDLFPGISERAVIAIRHFDKKRNTKPFSFFYGMVHKHILQEAVRISRSAQKHTEFIEMTETSVEDEKTEERCEIFNFMAKLDERISSKIARDFLEAAKLAIIDGENLLKVKRRVLKRGAKNYAQSTRQEIDWIIVRLRRKLWETAKA